ncbi:MAG: gliding motility-associated C-terminal domain-containing protein [Bacteroidales bacterium]
MKRLKLFILFSLIISTAIAFGQNPTINLNASTHNTEIEACGYWFYDDGGSGGNYSNNQDRWITFYSTDPTYNHIKIEFASMDLGAGDTLIIYDGPNTSSPVLIRYSQANPLTPTNSAVQATINNPGGRLTVRFKADGAGNAAGWNSAIGCIKMCQRITPVLDSILTNPLPTPDYYINLCAYDTLTLAVKTDSSTFPDNHIIYDQTPANTTFAWSMGDGTTLYGPVVSHHYNIPSGYNLSLTITDSVGCSNTIAFGYKVRISNNPITGINPLPDLCEGDSVIVTGGIGSGNVVELSPFSNVITAQGVYDVLTFIPDGPNCPTQCYGTPVTFDQFPPGATVQQASDIESICISMEHSFAGDLSFRIICPNGQSVVLDSYDQSGGNFLGEAWDYSSGCDPNNPQNAPGTPWLYCWSEVSNYSYQGTLNVVDGLGPSPIPATDTINHTNYLIPENPLSGLIGCPLNGTWSIEICDLWAADNGWVFEWMLTLSSNSGVAGWQYSVDIDSIDWDGQSFYPINDSTAIFNPDSSGVYNTYITVYDEYGCTYTSTDPLTIEVIENPVIDLGEDTSICEGMPLILNAGGGYDEYLWNNNTTDSLLFVEMSGLYSVTATNYNIDHTLGCSGSDTMIVSFIPNAMVDLGPDQCVTEGPVTLDATYASDFSYQWSTGENTPVINLTQPGVYDVSVNVFYDTPDMCSAQDTVHIRIIPEPIPPLPDTLFMCAHQARILTAEQPNYNNLYNFIWSTGNTSTMQTLSNMSPGVYMIQVKIIGCDTLTDSTKVTVEACDITIPNVITPNGDGINDQFQIGNLEYYPNSEIKIYNRWGKKIYESENYQGDWDGDNHPEGTYFYILRLNYGNGTLREFHGTITILY